MKIPKNIKYYQQLSEEFIIKNYANKKEWLQANLKNVKIKEMKTSHILNCLEMFKDEKQWKRFDKVKRKYYFLLNDELYRREIK